jgi:hypothetical protein
MLVVPVLHAVDIFVCEYGSTKGRGWIGLHRHSLLKATRTPFLYVFFQIHLVGYSLLKATPFLSSRGLLRSAKLLFVAFSSFQSCSCRRHISNKSCQYVCPMRPRQSVSAEKWHASRSWVEVHLHSTSGGTFQGVHPTLYNSYRPRPVFAGPKLSRLLSLDVCARFATVAIPRNIGKIFRQSWALEFNSGIRCI